MTTSTSPASPPVPPALNARVIGAAQRSTNALLQRLLDDADLPFAEWTILFTLAGTGPPGRPMARGALVRQQADGLKVPESTVEATLDGMLASGLLTAASTDADDAVLAPTAAGMAVYQPIRDVVDQISQTIYGDLPPDDLEVTRRTLEEVTRRADALLAGR
jgi:DNA-binding MarR family transcriptional regulator